jgi:short-subunit dehydrogenase
MPQGAALVTGASSGIGAELARLCAAAGYETILLARSAEPLKKLAGELRSARTLTADLADPAAPARVFDELRDTQLYILINNAGFGIRGPFAETAWDDEARLLQVNITSLAHLTKLFLPGMLQRRSGRILNVASTAAFVPGPFMAMYYASKAFVRSFSEALSVEVEGTGVTVTALDPGPTRTNFDATAKISDSVLFRGPVMDAAAVAREGFTAMMQGRMEVIAGASNRWTMRFSPLLSRRKLAQIARRLNSSG